MKYYCELRSLKKISAPENGVAEEEKSGITSTEDKKSPLTTMICNEVCRI
jgi:hypothetical protein